MHLSSTGVSWVSEDAGFSLDPLGGVVTHRRSSDPQTGLRNMSEEHVDGLQPNKDGLQPTGDGLQPNSDGLHWDSNVRNY